MLELPRDGITSSLAFFCLMCVRTAIGSGCMTLHNCSELAPWWYTLVLASKTLGFCFRTKDPAVDDQIYKYDKGP